jgi:hypothetical protein
VYKIIRGTNYTKPFDEGTLEEMKEGLSCVSILMKHLDFSSYFNESKESLFVRASRKRSVEYKIVKD